MIRILMLILLLTAPVWAGSFGIVDTTGGLAVPPGADLEDDLYGSVYIADSTATGDSICMWLYAVNSARNVKCALYRASDTTLVDTTEIESILTTDTTWYYFSFINAPEIKKDTAYIVTGYGESGVGNVYRFRTDVDATGYYYLNTNDIGLSWAWPVPKWTPVNKITNYKILIGCYYTTGGEPPAGGGRKCPVTH